MEESALPTPAKPKCIVYIDGFNTYYGALKQRPQDKWLNLHSFYKALRPREELVCVKYFTAIVDPEELNSSARDRQSVYLAALRTLPTVKIILGRYQRRSVRCAKCYVEYQVAEEKKTDVNIAVQMIGDAVAGAVESLVLVSGDSDLEPAIGWIREHRPTIKVTVYVPSVEEQKSFRRIDFYEKRAVHCGFLPLSKLSQHQLPNPVLTKWGAELSRPISWSPRQGS